MYSSNAPPYDWTRQHLAQQLPQQGQQIQQLQQLQQTAHIPQVQQQQHQQQLPQYQPQPLQNASFSHTNALPADMSASFYVPQNLPLLTSPYTVTSDCVKNYISSTNQYQDYQQMPAPSTTSHQHHPSVSSTTSYTSTPGHHSSNSSVSSRPFSPLLSPRTRQNSIFSNPAHLSPAKSPTNFSQSDSPHGSLQETGPSPALSGYRQNSAASRDNSLPPPTPLSLSAPDSSNAMVNVFNGYFTTSIVNILSSIGNILYSSPSLESILGHSISNLAGSSYLDYLHPDDLDE